MIDHCECEQCLCNARIHSSYTFNNNSKSTSAYKSHAICRICQIVSTCRLTWCENFSTVSRVLGVTYTEKNVTWSMVLAPTYQRNTILNWAYNVCQFTLFAVISHSFPRNFHFPRHFGRRKQNTSFWHENIIQSVHRTTCISESKLRRIVHCDWRLNVLMHPYFNIQWTRAANFSNLRVGNLFQFYIYFSLLPSRDAKMPRWNGEKITTLSYDNSVCKGKRESGCQ